MWSVLSKKGLNLRFFGPKEQILIKVVIATQGLNVYIIGLTCAVARDGKVNSLCINIVTIVTLSVSTLSPALPSSRLIYHFYIHINSTLIQSYISIKAFLSTYSSIHEK